MNKRTQSFHRSVAVLNLVSILLAAGAMYLKPDLTPWPLLLVVPGWGLLLLGHLRWQWNLRVFLGVDVWVALLIASAGVALWATYDRSLGLTAFGPAGAYKFWLICAAGLLYFAIAQLPWRNLVWVTAAGLGFGGALVSLYFILTHDFAADAVKFGPLNQFGQWVQAARLPLSAFLAGRALHPNVAGGLIAMFIPLLVQVVMKARSWPQGSRQRLPVLVAGGMGLALSALGLALSSSRGAWLGLAAALGGWLVWGWLGVLLRRRAIGDAIFPLRAGILTSVALLIGWGAWLALPHLVGLFPPFLGGENTLISRLDLMQESLLLVQAAPFTGIGLGTFPLVFSTQVLLIGVPFISHAHSVWLNILISQGWPGLLAYLGVLGAAFGLAYRVGRRAEGRWPLAGVVAMLVISLVHGLFDDPLYGSRAVILFLAPAGLIAAAARQESVRLPNPYNVRWSRAFLFGLLAGLVMAGLLYRRELAAMFETNLGVVQQAKSELVQYDPDQFQQQTLDQVRQVVDLSRAEAHYQRALLLWPGDWGAAQRLTGLALSRGQYELALSQIERIWVARPPDRVTRLLYGSALVAAGRPQDAAVVLSGITWAESRLNGEAWYRYFQQGDYRRAADAYRTILLLDPGNEQALYGLSEAQKRETTQEESLP